jgi:phosphatidylserine/phosphatidylglycerophosphate/cardiolipin synthase-like enzyme
MIELMRKSKESIKIIIWFWTDKKLAGEMLAVSQERNTKIITDDFNFFSKDSVFNDILKKDSNDNLEIITDENRREDMIALDKDGLNSFLHQHTMILDDSIVLAGTNNWSTAGFLSNDESIIISDIPFLVQAFKDSFDVNYSKNK